MQKIKKIMFVVPTITGGGAERVVTVMASSLAEQEYTVELILYERRINEYPISSKVNIHLLPARLKGQSKIAYMIGKFLYLRTLIKVNKPDVLIPFLPYQVEQCFIASRGLHIPFIVTVRNNPQFDTPNEKMRKRRDWIAKHAEGVFLQTAEQKAYFTEDIKKKSFIVPNPINAEILNAEYERSGPCRKFVTMGRLEPQKNHALLINAFAEVVKMQPELSLDIYGVGSLHEQLQKQIDDLGMQYNIQLCGRTHSVAETLCQYDAFVMSSDFEGMPNSLMEAMGVGLVCISTDCPTGPSGLIGVNERGMLIRMNDKQAVVDAIRKAANDNFDRVDITVKASTYICENYSPEIVVKTLIGELEKLCI